MKKLSFLFLLLAPLLLSGAVLPQEGLERVRRLPVQRWVLPRKMEDLRKVAVLSNGRTKTQMEFEVARKASAARAVPLLKLVK